MRHELWYTSASRGLAVGSSGFCTVKMTRGLPPALKEVLERLSQYQHVYPPGHDNAGDNPVVVSFMVGNIAGKKWNILSRICAAGVDHTNRTNFFAHHVAYDAAEGNHDPSWLVRQPGFFAEAWDFRTEELAECRALPVGSDPVRPCSAWQAVMGDAGWAGAVAAACMESDAVYLISNGSRSLLQLISEVACLLPLAERQQLSFSTQYGEASRGLKCRLRCVCEGSNEAKRAVRKGAEVFNLNSSAGSPPDAPLVTAARTGVPGKFAENRIDSLRQAGENFESARVRTGPLHDAGTGSLPPPILPPHPPAPPVPESEGSRSSDWLPVVSGLSGILLCVLILAPLLLWYRAGKISSEAEVVQLKNQVAELEKNINKPEVKETGPTEELGESEYEVNQLREEKGRPEKDLAVQSEEAKTVANLQGKVDKVKGEKDGQCNQCQEKDKEIKSLKKRLEELKKEENGSKIGAGGKSGGGRPPGAQMKKKTWLPSPPKENDKDDQNEVTFGLVPAKPSSILVVDIPDVSVKEVNDDKVKWKVKWGDDQIAWLETYNRSKDKAYRFTWKWQNKRKRDLDPDEIRNRLKKLKEIFKKLGESKLEMTFEDGTRTLVPLYFEIIPSAGGPPSGPPPVNLTNSSSTSTAVQQNLPGSGESLTKGSP